jgi:hypothetical protein
MRRALIISAAILFSGVAIAQQPARQPADLQSIGMHKQAFIALAQDVLLGVDQMMQELNVLRAEEVQLKAENAQLKADLAKANAPAPMPPVTPPVSK